jgi:hypothetical protein
MKTPALPFDEEKRLASLRESGLLDSGTNERFDRLTRLAKRLFNVPIALVTLVGKRPCILKPVMAPPTKVCRAISLLRTHHPQHNAAYRQRCR